MKNLSLSLRLMIMFAGVSVLVWLIAGWVAFKETEETIDEFFDTYQITLARQLAAADWSVISAKTQATTDQLVKHIKHGDEDDDAVGFAVFDLSGKMIFHDNENGRLFSFSAADGQFQNERTAGDEWRILRLKSADGKYLITVGQELEYRDDLAFDIVEEFMIPWLIGFFVLLVAIIYMTYFEFKPLRQTAEAIAARSPHDLSPIDMTGAPIEIRPLPIAMNKMLKKIEELMQRERSFIADAAHELRTPLTALKVQLEIAQMAKDDPELRQRALTKLEAGIDRASRLVEQLLALSKLEADNGFFEPQTFLNWGEIIEQLFQDYEAAAEKKHIRLMFASGTDAPLTQGNPLLLSLMLRNLIDNAIKYAPAGETVFVNISAESITVINSGTYVSDEILHRLGERFFRPAGQKETGSGLGLTIVSRIAALYNCSVSFANTTDGFAVYIKKA